MERAPKARCGSRQISDEVRDPAWDRFLEERRLNPLHVFDGWHVLADLFAVTYMR